MRKKGKKIFCLFICVLLFLLPITVFAAESSIECAIPAMEAVLASVPEVSPSAPPTYDPFYPCVIVLVGVGIGIYVIMNKKLNKK